MAKILYRGKCNLPTPFAAGGALGGGAPGGGALGGPLGPELMFYLPINNNFPRKQ